MVKNGFSKLEMLIVITVVSILVIIALAFIVNVTTSKNVSNFKNESISLINAAKNYYVFLEKTGKDSYIVPSTDGSVNAMCITVSGLDKNNLLINGTDMEGYIVVEKLSNSDFKYTAWLKNKKFTLDGYEYNEIKDLTLKKGLTKEKIEFQSVNNKFTGTSGEKGGTGSTDGSKLKVYEAGCIKEKIE